MEIESPRNRVSMKNVCLPTSLYTETRFLCLQNHKNLLGKKSNLGFYNYDKNNKITTQNLAIYEILDSIKDKIKTPEEQLKSEQEAKQIYSDIKQLLSTQPEFDDLDQAKLKITNFINK